MKFIAVFAAILAVAAAAPTTAWTLEDLTHAIQNPSTPTSMLPYLEDALNTMMQALFNGQQVEAIAIPTPAGLLTVEDVSPAVVMPAEVNLTPTPVPAAVVPAPAVVADATGSPLVQIIVNIKSQQSEAAVVPTPVPGAIVPEAVYEPEALPEATYEPEALPTPELVVELPHPSPVVVPSPVVIAPLPAPVVVAPGNPIDVIAVAAPDANPIDLLAPNPIDLLAPNPIAV